MIVLNLELLNKYTLLFVLLFVYCSTSVGLSQLVIAPVQWSTQLVHAAGGK